MTEKPYTGVILPASPPIDKAGALAVLELALDTRFDPSQIGFWSERKVPLPTLKGWETEGIYPIDLGTEKYHDARVDGAKVGSATDYVARTFGAMGREDVKEAVRLFNHNNQNGDLKDGQYAIAWIMREAYELPDADHADIVRRAADVVHTHLKAQGPRTRESDEELFATLGELAEATKNGKASPFRAGSYLRDLYHTGEPIDKIKSRVEWWIKTEEQIRKLQREARKEYLANTWREFLVRGFQGVVIDRNRWVAKEAMKYHRREGRKDPRKIRHIFISVSETGHVTIVTNELDVSKLAGELQRCEPGQWYHAYQQGTIMNAGPQYHAVAPTKIAIDELISLMKDDRFVPKDARS